MTDVNINSMATTISFEPDVITGTPPAGSAAAAAAAGGEAADVAALRAILRPIILELLEDELGQYLRMRG